jgi:hypothetical protein
MKTIHKFSLATTDYQYIELPVGSKILTVQPQGNDVCLWVIVDPEAAKNRKRILIFGTGHPMPDGIEDNYIGTYQLLGGQLVFHVFWED